MPQKEAALRDFRAAPLYGLGIGSIYTVGGRLIKVFEDAPKRLNYNEVEWDGRDDGGRALPAGSYLYRMQAGNTETTRKMTLVR